MKKVFVISSILFVFALLGLGVYMLVYRNNVYNASVSSQKNSTFSSGANTKNSSPASPMLQVIFAGEILQKVLDEGVAGATFSKDDQYLWYVTDTNPAAIRKQDVVSRNTQTIATLSYAVTQIRWSDDLSQALVQEATDRGERWHLVRLSDGNDTALKEGLQSPIWSGVGDRIMYVYAPTTGKWSLNLSKADGSDWKTLADLDSEKNVALAIDPQTAWVAMWNIPSAFDETRFQRFSVGGGDPQTLVTSRFGSDYLFSPDGAKLLIISSDHKGANKTLAGVANASGGEYRMIDMPTLLNKVVWGKDSKTLYYALPDAFHDATVVPDDYRRATFFTQDTFWKLDTETGKKTRLVDLNDIPEAHDATKLFTDNQERLLLFIDRKTHALYRIRL